MALIVEGVFDSVSGGILVYMSLVDLIAADFLSKRMRCNQQLQILSYITLLSGCFAMSALAIWSWPFLWHILLEARLLLITAKQ